MITFQIPDDHRSVNWSVDGGLEGPADVVATIKAVIDAGVECGCDYWGEIPPSLDTPWQAYLTICGALDHIYGVEPEVGWIPPNPAGYEPEGVVD